MLALKSPSISYLHQRKTFKIRELMVYSNVEDFHTLLKLSYIWLFFLNLRWSLQVYLHDYVTQRRIRGLYTDITEKWKIN